MQILQDFNLDLLKDIVNHKAKFQKVMLVFDDSVSVLELEKLHNAIKDICIFNKMSLDDSNINEIYNGYKMLIFVCGANSFFKTEFNLEEFVNVFLPTDRNVMPFFVDHNFKRLPFCFSSEINEQFLADNYFLFLERGVDTNIYFSVQFNIFYGLLNSILLDCELENINENKNVFSLKNSIDYLKNVNEFVDVKILKQLNLDYKFLPYLDYYLLLAFSLFVTAVKQKNLTLVDIYKATKDNSVLIEDFYAKVYNNSIYQLIDLNFFQLKTCLIACFKNLSNINLDFLPKEKITCLINKIKEFCKNSNTVFNYLYLFNIFGL